MSVHKVIENHSSENLYSQSSFPRADILTETLHMNGRVDVVNSHTSEVSSSAPERLHNDIDSQSDQQTPVEVNTDQGNSRLLTNGSHNSSNVVHKSNLKVASESKSFDSYMKSQEKSLLVPKYSAPVIPGYIIEPTVVGHNDSNIEDMSAFELADRYSDSYVASHKRGHPISHQSTFTCLLKQVSGTTSGSLQSIDSSSKLRQRGVQRIPVLNAASDELVEQIENISSDIIGLEDSFSSLPASLQEPSGSKRSLLKKSNEKVVEFQEPTEETLRKVDYISSESVIFDESNRQENALQLLGNTSHDSLLHEVELAEYSEPEDSSLSGWKLDRRSSGQLFWRRDSSSLNGIDPRNRVKFRYDVEVCEFETRNSEAEDAFEDEGNVSTDEEVYDKVNEGFVQASAQNCENQSSTTTVIYAFSIIAIVMGVLYMWLSYTLDTNGK